MRLSKPLTIGAALAGGVAILIAALALGDGASEPTTTASQPNDPSPSATPDGDPETEVITGEAVHSAVLSGATDN
jgi:hypothetical protein